MSVRKTICLKLWRYDLSIQLIDIQQNYMLTWFILHDGGKHKQIFKLPFYQKIRCLDKNISCMESAIYACEIYILQDKNICAYLSIYEKKKPTNNVYKWRI